MSKDINDIIQEIANEVLESNKEEKFQAAGKRFIRGFLNKDFEYIDWIEFCDAAEEYRAYKFAFLVLVKALQRGVSFGEYSEYLNKNMEYYEVIAARMHSHFWRALCGRDISTQIICYDINASELSVCRYYHIDTNNDFIRNLVREFIQSIGQQIQYISMEYIFHFGKSFGDKETVITSLDDIKCQMIFEQTEYYRRVFGDNSAQFKKSVKALCVFYRWLVKAYTDCDFLRSSTSISRKILFSPSMVRFLREKYFFTRFNPAMPPLGHSKIVYLTGGFDEGSTRFIKEDYFHINMTDLECEEYRELAIRYIASLRSSAISDARFFYLVEILQILYRIKQSPDCSSPNLLYLTNAEAILIKNYYENKGCAVATINAAMDTIRAFLLWCESAEMITFDALIFDYLTTYGAVSGKAYAIPDDDLIALNEYLYKKSQEKLRDKLVYAIFHLALQTEFRANQICHLTIDSIQPTVKEGEYKIVANSKTSYGDKTEYVISEMTYRLLKNVIEETSVLREKKCPPELKQYIFIYEKERPIAVTEISNAVLRNILAEATQALGLPKYSFSNFRDTHMTKAVEHIIRNNKSNMELSLLTKHKRLDTTLSHYADLEQEKMLEATYGVKIGELEDAAGGKIVREIPKECNGTDSVVESGCGNCSAESCNGTAVLSCLACKHFVTTSAHQPFFEKAIAATDEKIQKTDNRHEKEDLTTIKTLYVTYLNAIYKHKEEINETQAI